MKYFAAFFVLLAAIIVCAQEPLHFPPQKETYSVLIYKCLDGDTVNFYWLIPDSGRLFGINAPEVHSTDANEKTRGLASKVELEKLLPGGIYTVEIQGKEKFGRTLLKIFTKDGKDASSEMVRIGAAKQWDGKGPRP